MSYYDILGMSYYEILSPRANWHPKTESILLQIERGIDDLELCSTPKEYAAMRDRISDHLQELIDLALKGIPAAEDGAKVPLK